MTRGTSVVATCKTKECGRAHSHCTEMGFHFERACRSGVLPCSAQQPLCSEGSITSTVITVCLLCEYDYIVTTPCYIEPLLPGLESEGCTALLPTSRQPISIRPAGDGWPVGVWGEGSHLVSLGFTCIPFESLHPLCVTGSHLFSLGLTWFHLFSLGSTWFRCVSLGLAWSHLSLTDSLGLTWSHPGSLDSLGHTREKGKPPGRKRKGKARLEI